MSTENYIGSVHKSVVVRSSDPQSGDVSLELQGIVQGVGCKPSKRAYFFAIQGEEQTKEFTIFTVGEAEINVEVSSDLPYITVQLEKLTQNQSPTNQTDSWWQYTLIVNLTKEAPVGRISGKIHIQTTSPSSPEFDIFINGEIRPPVVVEPGTIHLWINKNGVSNPSQIRIRHLQKENLQIIKTYSSTEHLKIELQEKTVGQLFIGELKWEGRGVETQRKETIEVITNDPVSPRLTLEVILHPKND